MSFAWPQLLWLLLLPAALLGWELTRRRRAIAVTRPKILRAEAGARSLELSSGNSPIFAGRGPRIWLCLGLAFAIFALARPQWGRLEEPVFDQSREILLAIDLSRSMLAPDVKPARLDRAKLLIQSLLEKLAGERVGLVVFSGTAFLQSPLSADYEILREFLPALGPDFLPEGGTNYGALLGTAIDAFGNTASADRFLIILSDGEATDGEWGSQIEKLKNKNIRVIGLGVGTAGGAMIPDGAGAFVKDERGAVVLSRLESDTLQELARSTGGVYRDASAWVDLAGIIRETVEAGRKGNFVEKNTVRLVERFQWPLALALWCLLVSFYYEFPVRPKPRDMKLRSQNDPKPEAGGKPETGDRKPETPAQTVAASAAAHRSEGGPSAVAHPDGPPGGRPLPQSSLAALLCVMLALSSFRFPLSSFAASASTASPSPAEMSDLGKLVGRLSAAGERSARDWAELARETVTWGSRLQSQQQSVPEGPVRDALSAVELGSKLDAKTADWPKLREELEALLRKPEDQQQKNEDQQKQEQNQQDQQQQQSGQQQQQQQGGQQQQNSEGKPQQDSQQNQQSPQQPDAKQEPKPPGESAFGDMKKEEAPPPPPPGNTQKVGGAPERKENEPAGDPALALPLQKLDQLRNQDSPAQLFQLMEGDKKPTKKTGKDW